MNKVAHFFAVYFVFVSAALCLLCGATPALASEPAATAESVTLHGREAETDGVLVLMEEAFPRLFSLENGESDTEGALEDVGLAVTDCMQTSSGATLYAAEITEGYSKEGAIASAEELPGVVSVQPNYIYRAVEPIDSASLPETRVLRGVETMALYFNSIPNDPYASVSSPNRAPNQYWLYRSGLLGAWSDSAVDGSVTIAVLDAIVRPDHEDLRDNVLVDYAWDAVSNTKQDFSNMNVLENGGHGTLVSGVAAACADNGLGIAGASYNANILPMRVFYTNEKGENVSSTWLLCRAYSRLMTLCARGEVPGLRVVNMSLGSHSTSDNDVILRRLIHDAREKYGVVTVCAGGNGRKGSDGKLIPRTDPCYPADFEECVAVTALNADGTNVYWSDYNDAKDISASGEAVWSTYADARNGYASASGTSLAAPIVSGTFALLFAAVPNATVDDACEAIYETADPIVDRLNDRSGVSGSHGSLNAGAAMEYLLKNHPWNFKDVHSSDWCYNSVGYVAERGIMTGYADGSGRFGAGDSVAREQAAQLLYNYFGNGESASSAPQTDVLQGEWYTTAVNWAVDAGVMDGYSSTIFGVGDNLSRAQAACMFAKIAKADTSSADPTKFNTMKDADEVGDWARDAFAWALNEGVMGGAINSDGTRSLRPDDNVSRAQMAEMMANAIRAGVI